MDKGKHFVMGADFGSDSVRVVILDAFDGEVAGSAVSYYARWKKGLYCDPKKNQFRQHPKDYIESFQQAVLDVSSSCATELSLLRGICIDTTGSTPCLCDIHGVPLSLHDSYAEDPDAMFVLWKDHTSIDEAEEFTEKAHSYDGHDYTQYVGGTYSSEWFWAKMLHIIRNRPDIAAVAESAVEHCDWFPALLTDTYALDTITRSRCAAGHKLCWHESWGGYPSTQFLDTLDPILSNIQRSLGTKTYSSDTIAGYVSATWSKKLSIPEGIPVCVGAYDAHIGAVGGHVDEKVMVKSIGTSTCDIIIGKPADGKEQLVRGIAGQVDGSVVPGYIGYEAGQSAYGDFYAWFRTIVMWPIQSMHMIEDEELIAKTEKRVLAKLEQACEALEIDENSPIALDWINGRRSPHANQRLKGALTGLTLGTDAPSVMRMLLESTAFGARAILECFAEGGVEVETIIAIGGVARKSTIGMQILADVTRRTIHITSNDQSPAIGAAVFASVAAGFYPDVPTAQKALCAGIERTHEPNEERARIYDVLYKKYKELGAFEEKVRTM